MRDGAPQLLGTMTPAPPPDAAAARTFAAFLRVDAIPVPFPDPALVRDRGEGPLNLRAELTLISLDRGTAVRLLASQLDDGRLHAAVLDLVEKGQAKVERALPLTAKSGQRAVAEEIQEVKYPGAIVPPIFIKPASEPGAAEPKEKRLAAHTADTESRNAGLTIEIEPVIGPEWIVDINLVPQVVEYRGLLQSGEASTRQPPSPVFAMQKLITSTSAPLGGSAFLGTMSPPRASGVNGRKDDGRAWLAFIRLSPVQP